MPKNKGNFRAVTPDVTDFGYKQVPSNYDLNASAKDSTEMLKLKRWRWAVQRFQHRTLAAFPFQDSSRTCRFSVRHFGEGGLIAADFQREGAEAEKGQIVIQLDFEDQRTRPECTCKQHLKDKMCLHLFQFIRVLLEELSSINTPTAKRILENNYSKEPFNFGQFLSARATVVLDGLTNILPADETVTEDLLPQVQESIPSRLVWNFSSTGESLTVGLIYQKQKKRGDGWLKGRAYSPDELLDDETLLVTEHDRIAAKCIKRTPSLQYFTTRYKLDTPELIRQLVGHPSVILDGNEIKPTTGPLVMFFEPEGDFLYLKITVPFTPSKGLRYFVFDSGVVYADATAGILHAIPCTLQQSRFIKGLARAPVVIERSRLDEFMPQLEKIGKHIPIALPKDIAGAIQVEPIRPAILLRSRSTGELDFGLRIRDSQGRLSKPGQGSAVHYQLKGEKRAQWRRDFEGERQRLLELAKTLGIEDDLDTDQFYGTLNDFGRGIHLLESLELQQDQIEVCWDRTTDRRPNVVGSVTASNLRVQLTSKRDWFGIEGKCELSPDKSIDIAEIVTALSRSGEGDSLQGEFVRIGNDQWARISLRLQQRLKRLADHAHSERGKLKIDRTGAPSLEALMDEKIQVEAPQKWAELVARLRRAENLNPVVPTNLKAELRSYQEEGFAWMRRLAEWGVGGVLADDMGLGKTVQTLAVLLDRKDAGPALVIAPTSVGFNWARETARFAPDLNAHLYRDTDRGELLENVGPGDVVILSYGLALRDEQQLGKVKWGTMVLDEAQAVKNSRSKTAHSVANIEADWKLALTGTPVENHLGELWSIFRIVSPGLLGGWDQFRNKFAAPIERDNCPKRRAALSDLLQPFILRRTKSSVLRDLPERTEANLYVDLSKEERTVYDSWRLTAIGEIDGLQSLTGTQDARFQILAILTRLRQLACNVGLVDKSWQGESSKLALLMQTMEELRSEGHRALIFSQFTEHLARIRQAFDEAGFTYQYLDGSTPAKQRSDLVDRFQAGEGDAFLISLKAGGTGLNLTAADYVIHMDPWWNPAVEDQATDRAHRIGQTRPVIVYRIIAKDTIEEEILQLHETKRDLVAGILDGTAKAAKLSTEELINLIRKR